MRHAAWLWLVVVVAGPLFAQETRPTDLSAAILTPKPGPAPRINGARVFGVRPGSPILFTIPATGARPMQYAAEGLPQGVLLDAATGQLSGKLSSPGEHKITLRATNAHGSAVRDFKLIVGDKIALTPPMGWNSWYCYWDSVTQEQMCAAADAIVKTDLINHGYSFVNIDDGWSLKMSKGQDPRTIAGARDESGKVNANTKFPDMKAMTDYIHSRGLKAGIYTSPGPMTCAGYVGAYQHEAQDATRFAEWGFDFLKHDWCSYGTVAKDKSLPELKKPYKLMGDLLKKQNRDIVYNLCQYGMGDVSTWGEEVGAHCWRTAGDLGSHGSLYDGLIKDGFKLHEKAKWVRPGAYNDPDYLQVGPLYRVTPDKKRVLAPCPMSADEQYTHMSLWCLLAAPLFIGGDVADLDEFTIALLSNDEVIEVNQDPLCRQATRVAEDGPVQAWAKEMEDGSKAVGVFNTSNKEVPAVVRWKVIGVDGAARVRDLWRQKDLGDFNGSCETRVPAHGVVFVRVFPKGQ